MIIIVEEPFSVASDLLKLLEKVRRAGDVRC